MFCINKFIRRSSLVPLVIFLHIDSRTSWSYRTVPALVFVFIALCFALHPDSPIHTGLFRDGDDIMRLNQTIAWLMGQGWYDLSVPRLSPGAGTIIHWARLLDVPLALIILPLKPFIGMQSAAMVASYIVPMIWLWLLLQLASGIASQIVPDKWQDRAPLAAIMLFFAPMTLYNFVPGRVDHHNVQILIAGYGLYALGAILTHRHARQHAIGAGVAFAASLWVGAEIVPWVLLTLSMLGVAVAWSGERILAKHAALFAVSLAVATVIEIPLALAPAEYTSLAISWFSPAYALFAGLTAGAFLLLWGLVHLCRHRVVRLIIAAAIATGVAALFLHFVPEAWRGPFADYDPFDANDALGAIAEAQPVWPHLHVNPYVHETYKIAAMTFLHMLWLPLAALVTCIVVVIGNKSSDRRPVFICQAVFILAGLLLTLFGQVRVAPFMQFFSMAPMLLLLLAGWERIAVTSQGRIRFWREIVWFVVLLPLPILLIPMGYDEQKFYPDVVLFPAEGKPPYCDIRPVAQFLGASWGLGEKKLVVLSGGNEGPDLLFRTPHSVIAGNFNVPGNRDVFDFFHTDDEATAHDIARRWHADLVLICDSGSALYIGKSRMGLSGSGLKMGNDGLLHLKPSGPPLMIERLIDNDLPSWLKPVTGVLYPSHYKLFKVTE